MPTVTPRRSSRTRVERMPIINDSESLSDIETIMEEDEHVANSSSDGEGAVERRKSSSRTPRKRAKLAVTPLTYRIGSARKATPLKRPRQSLNTDLPTPASSIVNDVSCQNQIRIISTVFDLSKKKSDLKQCAEDWSRFYQEDSDSAIASIMSFVLHISGCTISFPTSQINDDLNDPGFTKPFQTSAEEANSQFGILNPNKTTAKRYESRLKQWICLWIESMPPSVLFESDMIARVIEWTTTLSQNSLRTIRLVACDFAFAVFSALIVARRKLQTQLSSIEKSLQQKSKRPAKAVSQMEEDKTEFQSNIEAIDQHISSIFQEIFVPRYRDIYPAVRERCVEYLQEWILASDLFASDAYFKYLGWALNSSYASVRSLAIRAIDALVRSDAVRPKMSSFLNRFIQRIIEMHNDVDETIGACAIDTCTTILVHDDILTNFESFGDVAPLLWDKSRVIREAAANYVFEDSFNPEGLDTPSKASLQSDIEQLFTIFSEAAPKEGSYSCFVATLVDLFFFKLSCVRDLDALVDALKNSADVRSSETKDGNAQSRFIAQLILSCCEYVFTSQELHSRFTKAQRTSISSVRDTYVKFISDQEYLALLKQFQAEHEDFACLVKLVSVVAKKTEEDDNCNNLTLYPGVGAAILAYFKRETNPVYLRPVAAALASVGNCDADFTRDLQQSAAEFMHSLQQLEISQFLSGETSLFALASLSRICCLSQQVFCPILQESEFFEVALSDLVRIASDTELDAATSFVENLVKISHSVILWSLMRQLDANAVQKRISSLLGTIKAFFSSGSEQLGVLSVSVAADLCVVALNNPQIRFCLDDDLFHLLREYISEHSNSLEIVKAGARLVCTFCPEYVSICATLLKVSADSDVEDRFQQIIKGVVAHLRSRNGQALASAILEALLLLFKDKGAKDASSLSRRMAMLYGVLGAPDSHFNDIIIGGLERFEDGEVDASFIPILHPFVHRSSPSMLKSVCSHIDSVRERNQDPSVLKELDKFYLLLSKKLPAGSATSVRAQGDGEDGHESIQAATEATDHGCGEPDLDEVTSRRSGL